MSKETEVLDITNAWATRLLNLSNELKHLIESDKSGEHSNGK